MPDLDELSDIGASDPIRAVIEIERQIRPTSTEHHDVEIVHRYYELVKSACQAFGIPFGLLEPVPTGNSEARRLAHLTKLEIDKLRVGLLAERFQIDNSVELDVDWRTKIHSYLATVRQLVQDANIAEALRERIFGKLSALEEAVDQRRTPVQKFAEVLVALCEGVSIGAEKLKPAVALLERVTGAIARLQSSAPEPTLSLPPPEKYGLEKKEGGDDRA